MRLCYRYCVSVSLYEFCVFFFFQAEDGIRDLVRSRGLGDVYKRQPQSREAINRARAEEQWLNAGANIFRLPGIYGPGPVSYTHLTLPTSDLV